MARITYRQASAKIEVPFAQPFVDAIKNMIPAGFRTYQSYDRAWLIYSPYMGEARRITKLYFPEVEEIGKEVFDEVESERQRWEEEAEKRRRERDEQYRNYGGQWGRRQQDPFGSSGYGSSSNRSQAPQTANVYETLGVTQNAPEQVVRAAWKALCVIHHPDKGGDAEKMKAINAAFDEVKKQKGWSA